MALGYSHRIIEPVYLDIDYSTGRLLSGAREAAHQGFFPGGLKNNRYFIGDCVRFGEGVPQECRDLLFDPQTSGGLLIAILPESAEAAISALDGHGVSARRIGKVIAKTNALLFVR